MFFTVGCAATIHGIVSVTSATISLGKQSILVFLLHLPFKSFTAKSGSESQAQTLAFLIYSQILPYFIKTRDYPGLEMEIQGPASVEHVCSPVAHSVVEEVCC